MMLENGLCFTMILAIFLCFSVVYVSNPLNPQQLIALANTVGYHYTCIPYHLAPAGEAPRSLLVPR